MTRSMRFGGCLHTDLQEIRTNLVPYPRISFIVPSYSPFVEDEGKNKNVSVSEITDQVF